MPDDDKHFDLNFDGKPQAFVQWKGTDVCMDFYCECGAHCHFDGYFAYHVKCPHCKTVWQMPSNLFPRKADEKSLKPDIVQMLEPDDDLQTEGRP